MTQPVALITGCSSGIGRALADAFQAAGYCVWASARNADDLAALSAAGFTAVQLDVNDGQALGQLAERLKAEAGGLDVLINNAGYGAMGPLLDGGVEAMRRQFETNVFSIVGVTRACFPLLRQNQGLVEYRQRFRRAGHSVCRRLLRQQSCRTGTLRRVTNGVGTLRYRGDGSPTRRHRLQLRQ